MLEELHIRNFVLIDDLVVPFQAGLNVISGETGEGKSLILSAILLLLGARGDRGLVRAGAEEASVEGRLALKPETVRSLAAVSDLVEPDTDELCIRRVILADGRTRAYLNGHLCPAGVLKAVGERLCDVHGQRDQQALLSVDEQRRALDRFGGLTADVETFAVRHREWVALGRRIEEIEARRQELDLRRDSLREQIGEIEDLHLERGETDSLETEWKLLSKAAELMRTLDDVSAAIDGGDAPMGVRLVKSARRLGEFSTLDARLGEIVTRLESFRIEADDLSRTCSRLRDQLEMDGARFQSIGERLDDIRRLGRKYQAHGDGLIDRLEGLRGEWQTLDRDLSVDGLKREHAAMEQELRTAASTLDERRAAAAVTLADEVTAALKDLRLPHARFATDLSDPDAGSKGPRPLQSHGFGRPRFVVSMNVGEALLPMESVTSGGELARILLALKGALADHHGVPMLVFDEIDSGTGGRIGTAFGRRIRGLSRHHQVVVVTHLAQVAAFADQHLLVRKRVEGARTVTSCKPLDDAGRLRELAEMLAGSGDHPHAAAQARELLDEARRVPKPAQPRGAREARA